MTEIEKPAGKIIVAGHICLDMIPELGTVPALGSLFVPGKDESWSNAGLFAPCFETNVVGITGAGDCTIAGFLAGLAQGDPPARAAEAACGIGGLSTEAADATGAVLRWEEVERRISKGWKRLDNKFI